MPAKTKRRKRNPDKWKVVAALSFHREQLERLKKAAKADGRSLSDYIGRRLAEADKRDEEKAEEFARTIERSDGVAG